MSKRKMILLAVAAMIALVTMVVARSMMTPPDAPQQPTQAQAAEILAAAHDLPIGTLLKKEDVKWISWPADAPAEKFFVKGKATEEQLIGSVMRQGAHEGEPILAGQVVNPHAEGFLAAVMTPGMRAMSITVTAASGVAGFVFPGDRVDVILTHGMNRKDNPDFSDRHLSETVLTNVRVLALDQKSSDQSNEPKVAQLATLEVTPRQAERLALAATMGTLSLSLRSLAVTDSLLAPPSPNALGLPDAHVTTQTWDSDISEAYPAPGRDDRLLQRVQIMRGKELSETTFQRRR